MVLVLIEESRLNMENVWRFYRKQDRDLKHLDTVETSHRVTPSTS